VDSVSKAALTIILVSKTERKSVFLKYHSQDLRRQPPALSLAADLIHRLFQRGCVGPGELLEPDAEQDLQLFSLFGGGGVEDTGGLGINLDSDNFCGHKILPNAKLSLATERSRGYAGTGSKRVEGEALLAHVLLFEAAQARGHDARASEVAEEASRVVAADDGQSPDVVAEHLGDGLAEEFVRVGDDELARAGVEDGGVA